MVVKKHVAILPAIVTNQGCREIVSQCNRYKYLGLVRAAEVLFLKSIKLLLFAVSCSDRSVYKNGYYRRYVGDHTVRLSID